MANYIHLSFPPTMVCEMINARLLEEGYYRIGAFFLIGYWKNPTTVSDNFTYSLESIFMGIDTYVRK